MSAIGSLTTVLATAEPMLLAVVGVLALVIIGLAAMAIALGPRPRGRDEAITEPLRTVAPAIAPPSPAPRPRPRPQHVRGGGGGGLAVAMSPTLSGAMVCPTCRTEFHNMTYCTRDARRLVPPEEMLGGPLRAVTGSHGKSTGLVCMACRRAYEPGLRSCPHDGNELVPFPVYNATRPRSRRNSTEPTGVIARICPVCAAKYDLNARFCGHDAGELV